MDVQVHYQGARNLPFCLEGTNRHRDVVEDAEPLPVICERMVRSSGEVAADAVRERPSRRRQGTADRRSGSHQQLFAPRKTETAQLQLAQCGAEKTTEVLRGVDQFQDVSVGQWRFL